MPATISTDLRAGWEKIANTSATCSVPPVCSLRAASRAPADSTAETKGLSRLPSTGTTVQIIEITNTSSASAIHGPGARRNSAQPSVIQSRPRPAATLRTAGGACGLSSPFMRLSSVAGGQGCLNIRIEDSTRCNGSSRGTHALSFAQ